MTKVIEERYSGEFVYPDDRHIICVFLLDISNSMNKQKYKKTMDRFKAVFKKGNNKKPIDYLNESLHVFKQQACEHLKSSYEIDVAVVTFGGTSSDAKVVSDFTPISEFNPPTFKASGSAPMGDGLELAVDIGRIQRKKYRKEGIDAIGPWIIMVTDGYILEGVEKVKKLLAEERREILHDRYMFWVVAVDGANCSACMELTQKILFVKDNDYKPIFSEFYFLEDLPIYMSDFEENEIQIVPEKWKDLDNVEWTDL